MLFTEGRFFLFFLLVFCVHWALRSHRARKVWLLAVSYAFYAGWDARFLALILFSTVVDFGCGLAMGVATGRVESEAAPRPAPAVARAARRPWMLLSVATNLGLLGVFKYLGFFVDSAQALSAWLGFEVSAASLNIVLPVGISFYTFQTMSYSIDVYRGRLAVVRDPLDFALFVAFFPQLVAGPIVRATEFFPQLEGRRSWAEHVALRPALVLFLVGFFKKACLADGIAPVVDPVFADPAAWSRSASWIAVALYHVQIYCDFSGYSDMAIASAALLGFKLPLNFNFPYLARSAGDFWRRWHITLASWLRDYLYLPLVGRHASALRMNVMLIVSLGLCGLWHGAGWNFVAFGLLHGLYLVCGQVWSRSRLPKSAIGRALSPLGWPLVTFLVLMTWPVFRIGGFEETLTMFSTLFGVRAGGAGTIGPVALWVLLGCTLMHWAVSRRLFESRILGLPRVWFPILYGFAWSMVLPWVADDAVPFIYFQF